MAGNVIVGGTAAGGYTQRINTGGHTLTADEPLDVGGRDQGPTPYELLLSALGVLHCDHAAPLRGPQAVAAGGRGCRA